MMLDQTESEGALVEYVDALDRALDSTTHAPDRPLYVNHLAEAARLVSILAVEDQIRLAEWIRSDEHSFGWSGLSGAEGEQVERAFADLVAALRRFTD
jgi:hypothetical protein